MKELNDDDIQKLLEQGLAKPADDLFAVNKDDIKAYQFLFEELGKEPAEGLPFNFAANVRRHIQTKVTRIADIKLYSLMAVIGVLGFTVAFCLLVAYNQKAALHFYSAVSAYKWVFTLALVCFLGIQYLDQKLVKEHK